MDMRDSDDEFAVNEPNELDDLCGRLPSQQFRPLAAAGFLPDLLPGIPPHSLQSPASKMSAGMFRSNEGKVPGKKTGDGWVGFHGWQDYVATDADVEKWEGWEDASVCLNTRRMAAVDIDVTNVALAREIDQLALKMLGPAPRRSGNWPKRLLPYRVSTPISKTRLAFVQGAEKHAVEVLGRGQQFVMFGIHPKTGRYYSWRDFELDGTNRFEDFTLVTPEQVQLFLDAVGVLVQERGYTVKRKAAVCGVREKTGRKAPPDFIIDHPSSIERAIGYLKRAQPAIEGEGGDDYTLWLANSCLDLGVSSEKTLELMLDHWNARCVPPWQLRDLQTKVANAFSSRANEIGCDYVGTSGAEWSAIADNLTKDTENKDLDWSSDPYIPFTDDRAQTMRFDRTMVPVVIADHAFDAAELVGTLPIVCALANVAAAGAALGLQFAIQPRADRDYLERAALWVALVAPSGGGKSPARDKAMAPLREIEKRWHAEDAPKYAQFKQDEALYKFRRSEWQKQAILENPAKDDLVNPVPTEPVKPAHRQLTFSDTTLEALADTMNANPHGIIGSFDELTAMFGGFDAYRQGGSKKPSKDRSTFLSAWSGGEHRVDRKSGDPIRISNFQFSLLGGIQPRKLAKMAVNGGMDDDGMIQRFLFAEAHTEPKPVERAPDAAARDRFHSALDALSRLVPGPPVRMSEAAAGVRAKLTDYVHDLKVCPSTPDVVREWLSKAPAQFARLCLIFHALEHVHGRLAGTLNVELPPEVSSETASMAAKFMIECLIPSAIKVLGELSPSPVTTYVDKVCNTILANGCGQITERDIYRAHHELQNDRKMIQEVMNLLCGYGWAVEIKRAWRGATAWKINPAVHRLCAAQAEQARSIKQETIRSIQRQAIIRQSLKAA